VPAWVKVGPLSTFPPGRGRAVRVGGDRVAVFNLDGKLLALQDNCPHMGASLADGKITDGRVTCHWHGWAFDLESGQGSPPAKSWACARVYGVKLEDGEVWVREREPPPTPADDWPW
jgi:nitrite reductase (NADH) small subunit/3-phenylpropionate/trans-cinnamate dioxygenase ferredoxin subunit